jgi:aryl-alcohol dehydrogenase-like predicted oxidoreductase
MDYARLGTSGLEVSRVVLGCMSFGDPARGRHEWSLDLDAARPLIRQALEAGITTYDTANVYSDGSSEEITGTVLGELARRDEILIATKVNGRMRPGPKGAGLSRGAILTQVDASLRRLGTDYIDLYQIPGGTRRSRSRRRWRHCTTSCARARSATSARPRCGRGSSRRPSTPPTGTAGPGSSRCRTSTT